MAAITLKFESNIIYTVENLFEVIASVAMMCTLKIKSTMVMENHRLQYSISQHNGLPCYEML